MLFRLLSVLTLVSGALVVANDQGESKKISEAFGHLIGKNLESLGVDFDLQHIVKGLQDAANGKNSPMTEAECIEAISQAQEATHKKQANENLANAEKFLKENSHKKNIVVVEEGKLQYKVEKPGKGAAVEDHASPVIRYIGKYADGTIFGQSEKDESISLDETIKGFQKGIVGMKEGEKRTLFIHPEFGYGTQGFLPPNSLLTFEIEVVSASSSEE